jgi:hypothetical protein
MTGKSHLKALLGKAQLLTKHGINWACGWLKIENLRKLSSSELLGVMKLNVV